MYKAVGLSALALVLANPALAQRNIENLYTAFEAAPDLLLTNPDPFQFVFFDRAAWAEATDGLAEQDSFRRINFGSMIAPVVALGNGGVELWEERAEIVLDDVNWFAGFGPPQYAMSYWGFASEASITSLLERLQQDDFEYVGESDILGNGEPQASNFDKRDPSNPWRGSMGQASFIQTEGNVILQSGSVPEAIEPLRPVSSSLADHAVVVTALTGLEVAMPTDASLVQALLISPVFGLEAIDPLAVISSSGSIDETKANLEAALASAGHGIAPYLGGILADLDVEGSSALAIALTYPNCDIADEAALQIIARWDASVGTDLPASAHHETAAGKDGLCAASLVLTAASSDVDLVGQVYQRVLRRDFSVLQIGTTP